MARFIYEAKTSPKDVIKGTLVADNKNAAIQKISRMGYYLLSLEEESEALNRPQSYATYFSDKISIKNITDFTRQLSDLLEANRLLHESLEPSIHKDAHVDGLSRLEGRVTLEAGAWIEASIIRGPAVIGARSRIIHSYVGPYSSIYYDALIENSEIEHSIVLEHARISGIKRIQDSLIGQRVEVMRSSAKPEAYRLMVGDSSRIEIP